MKNGLVIVAIAVIIMLVVVAMYLGIIPSFGLFGDGEQPSPTGSEKQDYSNFQIVRILEVLFGKDLNDSTILPYIDALDMEVYGVNDMTAYEASAWYRGHYIADGYASTDTSTDGGTDWTAYHEIFQKGEESASASCGDGASVKAEFGYDTMIIVSSGPTTTYQDFIARVLGS